MNIFQTNINNVGIDELNPIKGYQHHDAMWYDNDKHITYKALAETIYNDIIIPYNIQNILELGSGTGSLPFWLQSFDPNLTIVTLDGNKTTSTSPYVLSNHFVLRTDVYYNLTDDNNTTILFDLILSFEHLEHISIDYMQTFVSNIANHSHDDTIMICTAANWNNQCEFVHPTVLTKEQWDNIFYEYGFLRDDKFILNNCNTPFCFDLNRTTQLSYKRKHNNDTI